MHAVAHPHCLIRIAAILAVLFFSIIFAGDNAARPPVSQPTPKASTKLSADAGRVEVRFNDDSVLKLRLQEEFLDFRTPYGKLTIPIAEVRRIDLATRYPDGMLKQIDTAIANLGSADFRKRELATSELLQFRERAFPALLKAAKSTDPEVSRRAEEVVDKLRAVVPPERLRFREHDVIHTTDSVISGRVEASALKATTFQFGDVQLRLADALSIRSLASGPEAEIMVDASKHGTVQQVWLDTKLEFTEGAQLAVTASGEIDVYPIGAEIGQYVCTPKGRKRWGRDPGRMMDPAPGMLLGRVGENGAVIVLGDSYEGNVTGSGRLFLRIVGSPWDVVPSGNYTVKVRGGSAQP
jgi:hypothetical protein